MLQRKRGLPARLSHLSPGEMRGLWPGCGPRVNHPLAELSAVGGRHTDTHPSGQQIFLVQWVGVCFCVSLRMKHELLRAGTRCDPLHPQA